MISMQSLKSSRRSLITRIFFLSLALAWMLSLGVTQALAQATTFRVNLIQPVDLLVYVPCAAEGEGEYVLLTGSLHTLIVTTLDDQGGFHSVYNFHPQGISGTGETTGDMYHGVGETQGTFNGNVGFVATDVNNFKIVGQGPGNNFMIHENFHITVNPNGTLTAYTDNFSVVCN